MPYAQAVREDGQIPAAMTLLVKARANADGARARDSSAWRRDQNPNVPVGQVQPLEEVVAGSIANFRATIRVFISFAAAAILLAAIGIYGLVSYWVSQRTYEIGLRVAIGATRSRIVSMILAQGLRVALYGIVAGVIVALAATRFLASLLYGVGATDPTDVRGRDRAGAGSRDSRDVRPRLARLAHRSDLFAASGLNRLRIRAGRRIRIE